MPRDPRTRTLWNAQRCNDYHQFIARCPEKLAPAYWSRPDVAHRNRTMRRCTYVDEQAWLEFKARSDARAAERAAKRKHRGPGRVAHAHSIENLRRSRYYAAAPGFGRPAADADGDG